MSECLEEYLSDRLKSTNYYINNLINTLNNCLLEKDDDEIEDDQYNDLILILTKGKTKSIIHEVIKRERENDGEESYDELLTKIISLKLPTNKQIDLLLSCFSSTSTYFLSFNWIQQAIQDGYNLTNKQMSILSKLGYLSDNLIEPIKNETMTLAEEFEIVIKSKSIGKNYDILRKYVEIRKVYVSTERLIDIINNKHITNKYQIMKALVDYGFQPNEEHVLTILKYMISKEGSNLFVFDILRLFYTNGAKPTDKHFNEIMSKKVNTISLVNLLLQFNYIPCSDFLDNMMSNYNKGIDYSKILTVALKHSDLTETTIKIACLTDNTTLFDLCIENEIFPNQECLHLACLGESENIISKLFDLKMLADEICLINLINLGKDIVYKIGNTSIKIEARNLDTYLFELLVDEGAPVTYKVLNLLIMMSDYLPELEKHNIPYDDALYEIYCNYGKVPNEKISKKFIVGSAVLAVREMFNNNVPLFEIQNYAKKHKIIFDKFCYDKALELGCYDQTMDNFVTNAINSKLYQPIKTTFYKINDHNTRIYATEKWLQYSK
jgi:hypothetical protein